MAGDADKDGAGSRRPLFTLTEIRRLFTSDLVKLAPDAQKYLLDAANDLGRGSLRLCRNLITWAAPLERQVRRTPHHKPVTLNARVLEKVETDTKYSRRMREDIRTRASA